MKVLKERIPGSADSGSYLPVFYRITNNEDAQELQELLEKNPNLQILDDIEAQLRELIKSLNPSIKIKEGDYPELLKQHLAGRELLSYGVWVYYPWSNRLVHLLDEEEFVEVRTNRNRYKITRKEQETLSNKKIGIIGLSVGQSIALTLAMERACGELRLADFDTVELSNLNRIRTGVHNLGLKKTIIAAREIAEIDPYIKVKLYSDGITKDNIDTFFIDGHGKLDLLVEVCDGLDIKIVSRYKARELRVPVVMDTNDRGMLDIERFDLEPDRNILHGLADGLDPNSIRDLTNEEKVPYILRMIGGEQLSTRLKASMIEVEQSINTWPQLASSVTLGGAITTDVARRILLDYLKVSGRFYVDVEDIIKDEEKEKMVSEADSPLNPYQPLQADELLIEVENYLKSQKDQKDLSGDSKIALSDEAVATLVEAARIAPSAGNNQPWKWVVMQDTFFLFHDKYRSYSWGDFDEIGSHSSLGAAIENLTLKALSLGMDSEVQLYPVKGNPFFAAVISFKPLEKQSKPELHLLNGLTPYIEKRVTNRKLGERQRLPSGFYEGLSEVVHTIPGAEIQVVEGELLDQMGEILSGCDRERLLYKMGHEEFFHEIRWTPEQAADMGDGIDLALVDLTNSEKAGFKVAMDWEAIAWLEKWDKGRAFQKMSKKSVEAASSLVLFTMPSYDRENFIQAGRSVLRAWLYATKKGVSVHPMLSPVFFFNRLKYGDDQDLTPRMKDELTKLRTLYEQCFKVNEGKAEVFLLKLAIAEPTDGATFRLPADQIFQINN